MNSPAIEPFISLPVLWYQKKLSVAPPTDLKEPKKLAITEISIGLFLIAFLKDSIIPISCICSREASGTLSLIAKKPYIAVPAATRTMANEKPV